MLQGRTKQSEHKLSPATDCAVCLAVDMHTVGLLRVHKIFSHIFKASTLDTSCLLQVEAATSLPWILL